MEAPRNLKPRPPEPPPEVTDTSTLGGWVWVILFGMVMTLSIASNLTLLISVLRSKKKQNVIYGLLCGLFLVNLMDYSLLIFDFTLGVKHEYPHGQMACVGYQILTKSNPILQAFTVVIMVFYAASNYGGCCFKGPQKSVRATMVIFVGVLALFYGVISLPTAYFAKIVNVEDAKFCEIEAGGQQEISIYYLVHCILSFWLPLLLCITPLIRLAKVTNSDKYPEVTVVLATASSFFVFYSLHACIVLVRHGIDASGYSLDQHHSWMIKVAQSLLWLVAYFWHVTRPLLAFLMDTDLKICGNVSYDLVEPKVPLKVMKNQLDPSTLEEENRDLITEEAHSTKILV